MKICTALCALCAVLASVMLVKTASAQQDAPADRSLDNEWPEPSPEPAPEQPPADAQPPEAPPPAGPPPPDAVPPAPAPAPPPAAPPAAPPPAGAPAQPTQPAAGPPPAGPYAAQPPPYYPPQPGAYPAPQPGAYPPPPYPAGLPDPSNYRHDGFYLRMAIGGAWLRDGVDVDYAGIEFTPTGFGVASEIALGGSPTPGFVIGGGIYGVSVLSASVDELTDGGGSVDADIEWDPSTLSMIGPFVDVYPAPASGFHLQAAFGYAVLDAGDGSGTYQYANTTRTDITLDPESFGGIGFMLGIGIEGWLSEQWSMGGLLRLMYASVSNRAELPGGGPSVDWYHSVLTPALLVTWTYH